MFGIFPISEQLTYWKVDQGVQFMLTDFAFDVTPRFFDHHHFIGTSVDIIFVMRQLIVTLLTKIIAQFVSQRLSVTST
jgi:hypothetical protein